MCRGDHWILQWISLTHSFSLALALVHQHSLTHSLTLSLALSLALSLCLFGPCSLPLDRLNLESECAGALILSLYLAFSHSRSHSLSHSALLLNLPLVLFLILVQTLVLVAYFVCVT